MDDINTVHQAIIALNGNDRVACENAGKWLAEFQCSEYAWSISDRLLIERRDETTCYFAAQTIRQKLARSFSELPSTSYLSLRESIINHLSVIESCLYERLNAIINQLCLALCDLYLQVPEWTNFIAEILQRFSKSSDILTLLSLLRVFPEEVQSKTLRIGENRRRLVNCELSQQTNNVLDFLTRISVTNSNDPKVIKRILDCLSSWLQNPFVPTDYLASSPLILSIYTLLGDLNTPVDLHDSATEFIVSASYRAENTDAHRALALSLQKACFSLASSFQLAISIEDSDKIQNYAQIVCEMCESLLELMVKEQEEELSNLGLLDLLLLLSSYHEYTIIEKTFNVWYRLSEYMLDRNDDDMNARFKSYIERYIMILYKHCRFDTDQDVIPEESDDFMRFRRKVSDTIRDVVFIMGSVHCLEMMCSVLHSASSGTWDEIEAALFVISVIIHNMLPDENQILPNLMKSIYELPNDSHPILLITSMQIVGNAVDWFYENQDFNDASISWLLSKMTNINFVFPAATAVESFSIRFQKDLFKYFDAMYQVIGVLEQSVTKNLRTESAILCMIRSCAVVLNGCSGDEISKRLEQLSWPQAQRLMDLLTEQPQVNNQKANAENVGDSWVQLSHDPIIWIDRLTAIFRVINPWQNQPLNPKNIANGRENGASVEVEAPWLELVSKIWMSLSMVCRKYESNVRVIEHCSRAIRFLVRVLGTQSIGFVEQLVEQMVDIYGRHQHSCFLYLASILVDEYGEIEHLRVGLLSMLEVFCQLSFKLLEHPNGFRNHPDTIDDLFRLGIRFIQRAPSAFFQRAVSEQLFECGLAGLDLDHIEANRSLTRFFNQCFLSLSTARKSNCCDAGVRSLEAILEKHGESLVWHSLRATLFFLSRPLQGDMAELIYLVGLFSKEKLSVWLTRALENLPRDSGLFATSAQLRLFHKSIVEATELQTVVEQIRDLIRLYS